MSEIIYQEINNQIVPTMIPDFSFLTTQEPLTKKEEEEQLEHMSYITCDLDTHEISYSQWIESLNGDYTINNPLAWQYSDDLLVSHNTSTASPFRLQSFVNYMMVIFIISLSILFNLYYI